MFTSLYYTPMLTSLYYTPMFTLLYYTPMFEKLYTNVYILTKHQHSRPIWILFDVLPISTKLQQVSQY